SSLAGRWISAGVTRSGFGPTRRIPLRASSGSWRPTGDSRPASRGGSRPRFTPGSGGFRLCRHALLGAHLVEEAREEMVAVAGAGARLGVVLDREDRFAVDLQAGVRAVEQRD